MDVEQFAERVKQLAAAEAPDALRKCVAGPALGFLTQVRILLGTLPAPQADAAIAVLAKGYRGRDVDELPLAETELTPAIVTALEKRGIETIGQVGRQSDAGLAAVPGMTAARVFEVRSVERKYRLLANPAGHQNGQAGQAPQRDDLSLLRTVRAEVRRGVRAGETLAALGRRLQMPLETLRPMFDEARAAGKSRADGKPQRSAKCRAAEKRAKRNRAAVVIQRELFGSR